MINSVNNGGFTVTELLLVILIVGILFGIGAPYYQNTRLQFNYTQSMTDMLSLIKTARNYALTSRPNFKEGKSKIPIAGYGVYINTNPTKGKPNMILFSNDGSQAKRYDVYNSKTLKNDTILKTYTLPNSVIFNKIEGTNEKNKKNDFDNAVILFRPPLAEAFLSINGIPSEQNVTTKPIETLQLEFRKPSTPANNKADSVIRINKNAGFPEVEL